MRSIHWAVLLLAAVCSSAACADEGTIEGRKVTPPAESASPFDPSSAINSTDRGSWISSWLSIGLCLAGGIWVWRNRPGVADSVNGELWNVISHRSLDSRNSLILVQFADSLLLLGVSPNQISLLKEIEDPAQVAQVNSKASGPRQIRGSSLRQSLEKLRMLRGMA